VNFPHAVDLLGIEKDTLRCRGLSGIDVRNNPYVPDPFEGNFIHHIAPEMLHPKLNIVLGDDHHRRDVTLSYPESK
jgi:hypothetical protein